MSADPSTTDRHRGRLSTVRAAMIIARRDFVAILFSRAFIFFLLGPLLLASTVSLAGLVGHHGKEARDNPTIAVIMSAQQSAAIIDAARTLGPRLGDALPDMVFVAPPANALGAPPPDPQAMLKAPDPQAMLKAPGATWTAVLSGTLAAPRLTGPKGRIAEWRGPLSLVAAQAVGVENGDGPVRFPQIALTPVAAATADLHQARNTTAEAAQGLMFVLTMLLAGMVLSNLVEEKANKIIEILAAAIPMDAVFLGKLFAMLAVSLVGIACWATAGLLVHLAAGSVLPAFAAPAVGWPMFVVLAVVYFSMGYLVLGSLFLAIGSLASTVREVQTLSMPVTMLQPLVFYFAADAMTRPGSVEEWIAIVVPFSSPFTMLARAANSPLWWPHLAALAWQALCVALFVRAGAAVFRKRVMKSGPAKVRPKRRWGWIGKPIGAG